MRLRPSLPIRSFYSMLLCALACVMTFGASATHAAPAIQLVDPVTDNYKASYNANPQQTELRTWLATRALIAGGTTWAPTPPGSIQFVAPSAVALVSADGRSGQLVAKVAGGPVSGLSVRIDPINVESGGRWGLLATISGRDALRAQPASFQLSLIANGTELGEGIVSLVHDAALAGVAPGHIEYNGPGGRWLVGATSTRMNWEPAPATTPIVTAGVTSTPAQPRYVRARVTQILAPRRTSRRAISVRVRGRAGSKRITHVRFRVGNGRYTRWQRTRRGYRVVLPRGRATRVLRVQFRDAGRRSSPVKTRRITCLCN